MIADFGTDHWYQCDGFFTGASPPWYEREAAQAALKGGAIEDEVEDGPPVDPEKVVAAADWTPVWKGAWGGMSRTDPKVWPPNQRKHSFRTPPRPASIRVCVPPPKSMLLPCFSMHTRSYFRRCGSIKGGQFGVGITREVRQSSKPFTTWCRRARSATSRHTFWHRCSPSGGTFVL